MGRKRKKSEEYKVRFFKKVSGERIKIVIKSPIRFIIYGRLNSQENSLTKQGKDFTTVLRHSDFVYSENTQVFLYYYCYISVTNG